MLGMFLFCFLLPQVIGLLNLFSPAHSIEEFEDV